MKRKNTELFIDRKWGLYKRKGKGGIGSRNNEPHRRGQKYWREITVAGVKTAAACLGELTIT